MNEGPRPGPKPKRLYLRLVRWEEGAVDGLPPPRSGREFLANLDRVGRLVAAGELGHPPGDLLVFRAVDLAEAQRILRTDPMQGIENTSYSLIAWNPSVAGSGINLEPPPARGAGRLTSLQRVTVVVRDQAASTAWYRDVLGLEVRERDEETGFIELSLGKGAAALSLVAPRPEWGEPYYSESARRVGAVTGIVFQTDSVQAVELRLRHAGARITQPPEPQPWGGVTLRFADPDGNEFLAYQTADLVVPDRDRSAQTRTERARAPGRAGHARAARGRRT